MQKSEDAELMHQVKEHDDQSAFAQLLKRHYQSWLYFAVRMLDNQAIAEDMVQEICIKIWNSRHEWKPSAKVNTWVYTLLYRHCIDALRSQKIRTTETYDDSLHRSVDGTPLSLIEKLENEEILQQLKRGFSRLSTDEKAIFVLHYYHNMKQDELCEIFKQSSSAIESSLYRARKKLKGWLQ
ncbi:RNA polymerase sigma factor [Candidatus Berkiella cookevillensis]|uniref:RNA polymerase sigma factor n=1 Tax=Candidatus Berkiella cookevillensis TaxID=437022 RepID=A0A0Q9YV47_9GAMM|nr:RNA polymerase sigma factor [Candidatus Berkiella cookevillensis]MCS5708436.1 RNA polymerase sigma factor [Candidatus Berkiella cookevillensis]